MDSAYCADVLVDSVWEQEKLEARKMLDAQSAGESSHPLCAVLARFSFSFRVIKIPVDNLEPNGLIELFCR